MTENMKQLLNQTYKGNKIEEYILTLEKVIDILCENLEIVDKDIHDNLGMKRENIKLSAFEKAKESLNQR